MYYGNPNAPALNISITDLFSELLLSVDGPLSGRYSCDGLHTCALLEDGRVACWGYNGYGQLGVGDTTNRATPVLVKDFTNTSVLTNAVAIGVGRLHTCALLANGSIACWGYNYYGQLGVGDTTNRVTPVLVSNIGTTLPRAVAVATGSMYTCALLENGRVACWGSNNKGQLGVGDTTNRVTPVLVSNIGTTLPKAIAISAGGEHICALLASGSVACWGKNVYGQLGVGDTNDRYTPVIVANIGTTLPKAIAIAVGEDHTCALLEDGRVACWGDNYYGQLGDGTTTRRTTPVLVSNIGTTLPKAVAIAAGRGHTCALLEDGRVACWGKNAEGQLGVGDTTDRKTPVIVNNIGTTLPKAVAIAIVDLHTCALLEDGRVACWGYNYYGQLGDGTTTNRNTPVIVKGIGGTGALNVGDIYGKVKRQGIKYLRLCRSIS
jgi:Alpha-tubulin suppressor and related RCC1 domain-containing proteins